MQFIGLAGKAGSGKDTVADYLVEKYGFVKFAFSDPLYNEVKEAFGLPDESLLRDRDTKEVPTDKLSFTRCSDRHFVDVAVCDDSFVRHGYLDRPTPLSPRWILQMWGTEYRRTEDPDYWIKKAHGFVTAFLEVADPDTCGGIVNTGVRFPNEVAYIRSQNGSVWHIHRKGLAPLGIDGHLSEQPIPFQFGIDKEIHNNSTIERLRTGISLLYSNPSNRLIVEDERLTES